MAANTNDLMNVASAYLKQIEEKRIVPDRTKTIGYANEKSGTSVTIHDTGDASTSVSNTNQSKLNNESSVQTDISYEKNIITNRLNITTDDIVVNKHKLNPILYQYADMINSDLAIQGNLNMTGTVLVKAYDTYLEKFVYIRRPLRTPIFAQTMNQPTINPQFDIQE